MLILVLVVALIVLVYYLSQRNTASRSSATQSTEMNSTIYSSTHPVTTLDPMDMYDICYALGCLAGSIGRSSVSIKMQNRDDSRQWAADVIISAYLETGPSGYYRTNTLNTMTELKNFKLPTDVEGLIASAPFEVTHMGSGRETSLRISPKISTDYPAVESVCELLKQELKRGFDASLLAKINKREARIESTNNGSVSLEVR